MTNYEHLVETGRVDKLLNAYFCDSPTEVAQEYGIKRSPVCRPFSEDVAEWLQAEYKEPKLYVEVMDLIEVLSKYGRAIQDYDCTKTSSTIRCVSAEEIVDELRTYTEKEIISNAKTQEDNNVQTEAV